MCDLNKNSNLNIKHIKMKKKQESCLLPVYRDSCQSEYTCCHGHIRNKIIDSTIVPPKIPVTVKEKLINIDFNFQISTCILVKTTKKKNKEWAVHIAHKTKKKMDYNILVSNQLS